MEQYCELQEGRLTIHIPKELDHHVAGKLKGEADLLIETCQVKELIFDFADTEFMDSSGIGMIIGRCRNMGYYGGNASAINLNERVSKIFRVSGLHKLIQINTRELKK